MYYKVKEAACIYLPENVRLNVLWVICIKHNGNKIKQNVIYILHFGI